MRWRMLLLSLSLAVGLLLLAGMPIAVGESGAGEGAVQYSGDPCAPAPSNENEVFQMTLGTASLMTGAFCLAGIRILRRRPRV